ncbi:MAG TPA: DMT family transporter [Actinomycetota bacterium]|nr:DMT family transporter [Actinomycetota bacterium]
MFPIGLALASGLTWGSADFVGGLMSRRLPTAIVMVVSQGAGLILTAGLVIVLGEPRPDAGSLTAGALGGVAGAIGLASLYRGLAVGRMSIIAPTAALSGAVPVVVGFLQGERPATLQVVGMAVAGAGVLLAVRTPEPDVSRPGGTGTRGIGFALLAALFLGLFVTSLDVAGEASPLWASLMVRVVSVPLFIAAALVTVRHTRRPTGRETAILAGVGALDNGANVMFAFAAREGLLTIVSVLGSLYPVATVLLARWFLHERLAPWQVAGIAAAFVGVALIAGG